MGSTKEVPKKKLNKVQMTKLLQEENDFATNLLLICDVPYTAPTDETDELYINMNGKNANRKPAKLNGAGSQPQEEVDEDVVMEIMERKKNNKKVKISDRGLKKKEKRSEKKMKKTLVTAGKALKNGLLKHEKSDPDQKPETKPDKKQLPFKPVYNSDGKLVFSKFDFAAGTSALAKNKKKGQKSAEVQLEEIKKKDKQIKSLMQSGEKAKALEIKSDLAWRKAFDKVEGRKVKDDVELLKKTIHKREVKKTKSKNMWSERKKHEDHKMDMKSKKRQDNINKKIEEKKKKKVKKLSKKGRVMPGF